MSFPSLITIYYTLHYTHYRLSGAYKMHKDRNASGSPKSTASGQETCAICCQKLAPKDEVLFCSGSCQKYLHRYCTGVGELSYKLLSSDGAEPFLCYCCFRAQNDEQISILRNVIKSIKNDISALKTKDTEVPPSSRSYSSLNHERKFNAILFGVNECAKGLSRLARYESDLNSVVSMLSSIDPSFQSRSIRDCFRLGKFSPNASRPRPLLVKFFRVADVSNILSKKRALLKPFSLKPDMSYEQRVIEYNLLKERWSLIQSGTNRSDIKIRGNNLYLCGRLHGRATMSEFKPACQPPDQVHGQP